MHESLVKYASLYFCCAIEDQDNELITLEIIHRYVELLDKYFGSVGVFSALYIRRSVKIVGKC
ncbi:AP-1 complex subunit sigma-2-like, partial [Tachysurus ichikawai]